MHPSNVGRKLVIWCKQRTAEAMNTIDENDNKECEVCFDKKSVYIPLFPCTHSHLFCQECVKHWLAEARSTCPKCRAKLPIQNYLETTGQTNVNIADVSITVEYDPPLANNFPSSNNLLMASDPSPTNSCSITKIVCYLFGISIVILIYLIIHWYSNKIKHNG